MTGPKTPNAFRLLHGEKELLRLPNAWDAGSARLFETVGAKAIATTSAGMAWALGYPDGGKLSPSAVLHVVGSIRRAVTVPISIDIENGYSDAAELVVDFVLRLIEAGVDGINIEDGRDSPDILVRKVDAIRTAASKQGVDVFINVRTDVFLAKLAAADLVVKETIARGARYRAAGADGLFVPGLVSETQIQEIVKSVQLPINVMAGKGLPSASELQALGVKRLSAGAALAQMVMTEALDSGQEFLKTGRSELFDAVVPYSILQNMFTRH